METMSQYEEKVWASLKFCDRLLARNILVWTSVGAGVGSAETE